MNGKNSAVRTLFEKHIKGTDNDSIVVDIAILLCHLSFKVAETNKFPLKVYLKMRVLKHIYDKRPAEEFDCILDYLKKIVKYPDFVYKNKDPKRGDYAFVKTIGEKKYFCSLQTFDGGFNVATVFRLRKARYIKSYDLLWSWRGDIPSS